MITDVNYGTGGLICDIKIMDYNSNSANQQYIGDIDALDVDANAAIRAQAKAYAESNFATEFGILDTVKLVNPLGS